LRCSRRWAEWLIAEGGWAGQLHGSLRYRPLAMIGLIGVPPFAAATPNNRAARTLAIWR